MTNGASSTDAITTPAGHVFTADHLRRMRGGKNASASKLTLTGSILKSYGTTIDEIISTLGLSTEHVATILADTDTLTGDAIRALDDRKTALAAHMRKKSLSPAELTTTLQGRLTAGRTKSFNAMVRSINGAMGQSTPSPTKSQTSSSPTAPATSTSGTSQFSDKDIILICGGEKEAQLMGGMVRRTLALKADPLNHFMSSLGFTAAEVSRLLRGIGWVEDGRELDASLIQEKERRIMDTIDNVCRCIPQFELLLTKMNTEACIAELEGLVRTDARIVDSLCDRELGPDWRKQLTTTIPADAGSHVAGQSPAATRDEDKGKA